GEFSSRLSGTQIPYMCIIAHASTNRMILVSLLGLIAASGCGMLYYRYERGSQTLWNILKQLKKI
ncbi:MAG: hypothetical protein PHX08_25075, partial [Lachnospiraceae bacterium]|nr:hypothetical protein [Lachnospiraceae bacterium]